MFESISEPVLPLKTWFGRFGRTLLIATLTIGGTLAIGTVGYHLLADMPWLDAALNAAMILTGMGPVDRLQTPAAKVFAIFYALFSSLVVLGASGLLLAPVLHRVLHQLHADPDE